MLTYVLYCLNIFFTVLEVIVLVYMVQTLIPMGEFLRRFLLMLMYPMLYPMQKLLRHSVLSTFSIDLSPYVILIILNYLGLLCTYLSGQ